MKFKNADVWGFEHAIRGMRNPLNSWDKSDSGEGCKNNSWDEFPDDYRLCKDCYSNQPCSPSKFVIGDNDMDLMKRLIRGGSEHRKALRQVFVSVDITAPLYWWKEMDTYKIGTTANSTSTMHKLATTPITMDCFETDDYDGTVKVFDREPYNPDDYTDEIWDYVIDVCETLRQRYVETKDKKYWKELIRLLPESWLQTRTWTANYEVLRNIVHQREGHKLTEWQSFINWVHTLPYAEELIFYKGEN